MRPLMNELIALRKGGSRIAHRLPFAGRILDARRRRTRRSLLEAMPRHSVCAEVGVWRGAFSQVILDVVRPRELHLIDPWTFQADVTVWAGGARAADHAYMDAMHDDVVGRFRERPEVVVHRADSATAAQLFPAGYFDWVYIDADHRYTAVKDDLEKYEVLVKPGGFVTGDDYYWRPDLGMPVKRAVDERVKHGAVELVSVTDSQFILRKR